MPLKDNIKQLRTALGLTLEELARQLGVSRQTIQRYESGVISNIPSDNIEKLAIALKTTPACLMGWDKSSKETVPPNQEKQGYYLDPKTAQIAQEIFENKDLGLLFDASRKLQPDELLSVKNLVETMVRKERGEND